MNEELRQMAIETLRRGEELPVEWAPLLFPPQKREYELTYVGKEREEEIIAGTLAVPLQPVRIFGRVEEQDPWHNMLIFGDNLQTMKTLLEMKLAGQLVNADGTPGVRLVYIDPPFGTGDEYGSDTETAYSAKIRGTEFIEFLRKRLIFIRELLSDDGSVYVRLDYHFGHYIKVVMDEIFGEQNFQNDIVINRVKRRLRGIKRLNVGKESIFLYSKKAAFHFNPVEVPRKCDYCGSEKQPIWDDLTSPGLRNPPERIILGETYLPRRGRHFTYTQDKISEMEQDGRIRLNPEMSYYDLEGRRIEARPEYLQTDTVVVDDNWTDIKGYAYGTNYPTENSEQLLERVIRIGSAPGDIVLDAFAGSGTTCAVAEKLGRRWIAIDCGKLAIYTIQKRLLSLKERIGQKGKSLTAKPFTLYNAGLYDFSTLRQLPWKDWRFFALQLFGCRSEPHTIGGLKLDGKRQGASVLVFNHLEQPGRRIDEETIQSIHAAVGEKVGSRFFIIAPRGVFDFQQDYIDMDGVRYYALRIPYSFINELHHREFTALKQPSDETDINSIVDAVGFDFIRPPQVKWAAGVTERSVKSNMDSMLLQAYVQVESFESRAYIRGKDTHGGMETLSMVLVDLDYDGDIFVADQVHFAGDLKASDWCIWLMPNQVGTQNMIVFIDIYGNEAREIVQPEHFGLSVPATPAGKGA